MGENIIQELERTTNMPSTQILDFDALLQPIPGDNPAGRDIRYEGPYDIIREARRAEPVLDQKPSEIKKADWNVVVEHATATLSTQSKDLQIAVWLCEALINQHGFAGLRDGLYLLNALLQQFWDSVHPGIEDEDLEFRAGPFEWMNETFGFLIKNVTLTQGSGTQQFSYVDRETSQSIAIIKPDKQDGAPSTDEAEQRETFAHAMATTSLAYCQQILDDLQQSLDIFNQLDQTLDEKFGPTAPSVFSVREALDQCLMLVKDIVKDKGGKETTASQETISNNDNASSCIKAIDELIDLNVPSNRQEALQQLERIATFFRKTEPHSPVSYLIQRAVSWGNMPLEAWLQEVVKNQEVLHDMQETLGLARQ